MSESTTPSSERERLVELLTEFADMHHIDLVRDAADRLRTQTARIAKLESELADYKDVFRYAFENYPMKDGVIIDVADLEAAIRMRMAKRKYAPPQPTKEKAGE